MALQINKTTTSNFQINYVRIGWIGNKRIINGEVVPEKTNIFLEYWKDADTRNQGKTNKDIQPADFKTYESDQSFSDVTSAYDYLKTLDDFQGAVDC